MKPFTHMVALHEKKRIVDNEEHASHFSSVCAFSIWGTIMLLRIKCARFVEKIQATLHS